MGGARQATVAWDAELRGMRMSHGYAPSGATLPRRQMNRMFEAGPGAEGYARRSQVDGVPLRDEERASPASLDTLMNVSMHMFTI